MISIIDYGVGNLKSVQKALEFLGAESAITSDRNLILSSDGVILPGVGAFGDAMGELVSSGLEQCVKEVAEKRIPLLGICVGLQLLFENSEESPGIRGLGILPGKILRLIKPKGCKIPHMGWNSLKISPKSRLFKGLSDNSYVYFVHSYYLKADDLSCVSALCEYGTTFHAAVESDNIYAVQFHPEKSGRTGLAILKNFIDISGEGGAK